MDLRTGTSGYSYRSWRGAFYPAGLAEASLLDFYARRLDTVELNHTFHRIPSAPALAKQAARTPPGFVFAVKAPRRLTHVAKLDPGSTVLDALLRALEGLGDRLGPVLFQLPPSLPADEGRLGALLARLPRGLAAAFEFRHPSWLAAPVLARLERHGAALCLVDGDERSTPRLATAPFGYLRLRRTGFGARDVDDWLRFAASQRWERVFAYFKHEDSALGARLALLMAQRWREGAGTAAASPP
jgi:uncharacterized protein YecE (DUF72 family)